MKTTVKGRTREVIIDTEGHVTIIGESINPTRRKKLVDTLSADDFSFVLELAESQINAGADILDVNVGFPGVDDVKLLPLTAEAILGRFDIPLCLDSPNPAAIEAALKVAKCKCIINSVTGEEQSLEDILPIARDYGAAVIGLTMDDDGISNDPARRLQIAEKIVERAVKAGVPAEDVIIDPMAMAVSADTNSGLVTLETIAMVHQKLGLNISFGASNVSFGLPSRGVLNSVFLAMAIIKGLTCAIANPVNMTVIARAADLLLARDDFAMNYVEHFQGSI
jgi:5-methyltetrahydrofolate--homocysteine methyltransferase